MENFRAHNVNNGRKQRAMDRLSCARIWRRTERASRARDGSLVLLLADLLVESDLLVVALEGGEILSGL